MSDSPTFAEVLGHELAAILERRWNAAGRPDKGQCEGPTNGAIRPPSGADPVPELELRRQEALDAGLVGLAFSGGGIRSGTSALGFLQGLARLRLLPVFDYLSTVSGGGYVGTWLAAWVYREGLNADGNPADTGAMVNVEKQLTPSRDRERAADRTVSIPDHPSYPLKQVLDEEPEPVHHLRAYSNYLAPRPGAFTGDSWTLVAIYLRNTLVNLAVLIPAALAVVLLCRLVPWAYAQPGGPVWVRAVLTLTFFAAGGVTLFNLVRNQTMLDRARNRPVASGSPPSAIRSEFTRGELGWRIMLPAVVTAALAVWLFGEDRAAPAGIAAAEIGSGVEQPPTVPTSAASAATALTPVPLRHLGYYTINGTLSGIGPAFRYVIVFATVSVLVGLSAAGVHRATGGKRSYRLVGSAVLIGTFASVLLYAALRAALWSLPPAAQAVLGPPVLLAVMSVSGILETAITSRWLTEYEREWRSRLGAELLRVTVGWVGVFTAMLYLPGWVAHLSGSPGVQEVLTPAAVVGWVLTTLGGLLAGHSPKTGQGAKDPSRALEVVAVAGPVVFLVGLLALLSVLAAAVLPGEANTPGPVTLGHGPSDWRWALVAAGVSTLCAVGFSLFVDINTFSMHALYANRLTRCYLGASRRKPNWSTDANGKGRMRKVPAYDPETGHALGRDEWFWGDRGTGGAPTRAGGGVRRENPVSGFDPHDDLPLADLRFKTNEDGPDRLNYFGPYPLFNTSLNLVAGEELAVQDRKAESFVLTPDFCGSKATGYARTPHTGPAKHHLTLGRAMTISGAAVDPNMAVHQSPSVTALMTVFNARLGWWLENPRAAGPGGWTAGSPRGGMLVQLAREFAGLTDERGSYVHLTDGGHFENLGVYELIRRRCRFVVACDFAEDRHDASENLANLIRLVRIDFGIRIEIDTSPLREGPDGLSRWHVAIGTIRYDDVDARALAGTLVFVRSSLTGDESSDLRQFADTHPDFPHTPTGNQFFDEARFESYRALGDHIAHTVFGDAAEGFDRGRIRDGLSYRAEVRKFFAAVRNRWFPPPPGFDQNYAEMGEQCAGLLADIREDPALGPFTRDLYPELDRLAPAPAGGPGTTPPVDTARAELLAVNQTLDLMEVAWLKVSLNGYHAHPMNRGWMNFFRRWTAAPTFQTYWPLLRGEYSKDFVRFCERSLNLPPVGAEAVRLPAAGYNFHDPTNLWSRATADLNEAFRREWADELEAISRQAPSPRLVDLARAIRRAARNARFVGSTPGDPAAEPLVWFVRLRAADGAAPALDRLSEYYVGALAVYRIRVPGRVWYEALFWIRGGYRSLGLGRQTAESPVGHQKLFEYVRDELRRRHPGQAVRVIARYPTSGSSSGDRLRRAMWMTFFHDYEFRHPRTAADGPVLLLEYAF